MSTIRVRFDAEINRWIAYAGDGKTSRWTGEGTTPEAARDDYLWQAEQHKRRNPTPVTYCRRPIAGNVIVFTIKFADGRTIDFSSADLMADYMNHNNLEIVF